MQPSKVQTQKTVIVPNEKAPEGANSVNGAADVIFMEAVKQLMQLTKTQEYQYIESNLLSLIA